MVTDIHPTAVIDPSAELGEGVRIGPHAVVGADVSLGDGTEVGAQACVRGPSVIGRENRIFSHACIGFEPQDLKFKGEKTRLEVGDRNLFREFCSIHRGTVTGRGVTTIGSGNLFMTYAHVAHDCRVGDSTVFANAGTLAGHVTVGDGATVGAFSAVQQFCRVGQQAYIGGFSVITMDVLPFMRIVGAKPAYLGVNRIGLERKGFSSEAIAAIEGAMRLLLRSGRNTGEALAALREEYPGIAEVEQIIDFVSTSERGIIKTLPGKRRARGA